MGRDVLGLGADEPTIASELREHGFPTGAFLAANPYLSPRFGYHLGFDVFRDFLESGVVEFASEQGAQPASKLRGRANRRFSQACHKVAPLVAAYDELYFHYSSQLAAPVNAGTHA